MSEAQRVAVLASGGGTNLQALLDADLGAASIALVIGNVAGAKALERAKKAGVPAELIEHGKFSGREAFDAEIAARLKAHGITLVCLAGFMRLVGPPILEAFPQRVLNIHPALLPSFPGLHAIRQALAAGVKVTGATVHFVDAGLDSGPILLQGAVPVLPADDEDTLGERVLTVEHRIYPEAVRLVAAGRVRIEGRRTVVAEAKSEEAARLFSPPVE